MVLRAGTDDNVELAVDTFLKYYPNTARVDMISSWQELQEGILSFPNSYHVIFGHGLEEGLSLSDTVLDWGSLREFINTKQSNDIPVMACYSGASEGYYLGWEMPVDAKSAGILASMLFIDNPSDTLLSLGMLYQLELKNPLYTGGIFPGMVGGIDAIKKAVAMALLPQYDMIKEFTSKIRCRFTIYLDRTKYMTFDNNSKLLRYFTPIDPLDHWEGGGYL